MTDSNAVARLVLSKSCGLAFIPSTLNPETLRLPLNRRDAVIASGKSGEIGGSGRVYEVKARCLVDNTRLNFYEQSQITNSNATEGGDDCLLNVTIRSAGDGYDQYPIRHGHHRPCLARNSQFHMIHFP